MEGKLTAMDLEKKNYTIKLDAIVALAGKWVPI